MDNKTLNWIIFGLVALIIVFATLAIYYNPNLTGFLGLGKTTTAVSTKQIVVVMPTESSTQSVSSSSSSTGSSPEDAGIVRLFVTGESTTNQNNVQDNEQNYQYRQNSQTNQNNPDNYYDNEKDYDNIPEKQVTDIQYIQVPERVVYVNSESFVELHNIEQPQRTNQEQIMSSDLPGSNFNIPVDPLPDLPSSPKQGFVDIANFAFFDPSKIVSVGDSVTWTNNDQVKHTVTSDSDGELNSRVLRPGQSYTHTFNSAGTFYYHCRIHPEMRGVIIVTESRLTPGHIPFLGNQQYPLRG